MLEQKLKEIVGMREAVPAFAPALDTEEQERTESSIEAEARAEAELFYQQRVTEKRQESQASSANESGAV